MTSPCTTLPSGRWMRTCWKASPRLPGAAVRSRLSRAFSVKRLTAFWTGGRSSRRPAASETRPGIISSRPPSIIRPLPSPRAGEPPRCKASLRLRNARRPARLMTTEPAMKPATSSRNTPRPPITPATRVSSQISSTSHAATPSGRYLRSRERRGRAVGGWRGAPVVMLPVCLAAPQCGIRGRSASTGRRALVPRQATFARQGAASGACSGGPPSRRLGECRPEALVLDVLALSAGAARGRAGRRDGANVACCGTRPACPCP